MLVDVDLVYLSFADVALCPSMTRLIPEVIIILPWDVVQVGEMIVLAVVIGPGEVVLWSFPDARAM